MPDRPSCLPFYALLLGAALMFAVLGSGTAAAQAVPSSCRGPIAATPAGSLCGARETVDGTPVDAFLGIPYAAPPRAPIASSRRGPPPAWSGVRDATAFGPVCPQTGDQVTGLDGQRGLPLVERVGSGERRCVRYGRGGALRAGRFGRCAPSTRRAPVG